MTNRDRYRKLTDRQIAIILSDVTDCQFCECQDDCVVSCVERLTKWLGEEVKDDGVESN